MKTAIDSSVLYCIGKREPGYEAWQRALAVAAAEGILVVCPVVFAEISPGLSTAARVSADLAALDASGVHGPAVEADRRTIRAGIAALEGRSADALPLYREALRAWRELGLGWDEALCGLDMATLLDPADSEVRTAADAAREIIVRLGAAPFIARLDAALARSSDRAGQSAALKQSSAAPLATTL